MRKALIVFIALFVLITSPVVAIQKPELFINGVAVNLEEKPEATASVQGNDNTIEHTYQLSNPIITDEYEVLNVFITFKPDPYISYSTAVIDLGDPSTFNFTFNSPINPVIAIPNQVRSSMSLSATDGGSDGVVVNALAPPAPIPVDSDGITEMQVTTVTDGSVRNNIGLDLGGPGITFPNSSQSVVWGPFNEGSIPGPVSASGWNNIQLDINFQGSGGGDIYTISGRSDIVPATSKIGIYNSGTWYLDMDGNGVWDGTVTDRLVTAFGLPGWTEVAGDWNGDGRTEIGIYQDGTWYLDMNGNGVWDGTVTDRLVTAFGMPGWTEVAGDWNGDNRTEIGIYQDGTWYLDMNSNGVWDGTVTDRQVTAFGMPGWTEVAGDWNGDNRTEIGIYQDGTWYLDMNSNGVWDGTVTDRQVTAFGMPGWTQVVGDWNGDGRTEIGIYQDGTWYLDMNSNGVWDGPVTDRLATAFGLPGWTQVVGDWNADGRTEIGIYRDGTWYLDMNSNGVWDGTVTDRLVTAFGLPGWTQVTGKW